MKKLFKKQFSENLKKYFSAIKDIVKIYYKYKKIENLEILLLDRKN